MERGRVLVRAAHASDYLQTAATAPMTCRRSYPTNVFMSPLVKTAATTGGGFFTTVKQPTKPQRDEAHRRQAFRVLSGASRAKFRGQRRRRLAPVYDFHFSTVGEMIGRHVD